MDLTAPVPLALLVIICPAWYCYCMDEVTPMSLLRMGTVSHVFTAQTL